MARDGSVGQRWVLDAGDGDAGGDGGGNGGPREGAHPERHDSPGSTPKSPNFRFPPDSSGGESYEVRFAQVGDDTAPSARSETPLAGVHTLRADVLGTVTTMADTVASCVDTAAPPRVGIRPFPVRLIDASH
jgi:hypothetical protein